MWRYGVAIWLGSWLGLFSMAEAQVIERFDAGAETRWRYISDGVMGGVSQGRAEITADGLRLTGQVSTDNNGGFIQVRHAVQGLAGQALVLRVRGNGQRYTVFLRTSDARRPWHNYKVSFIAGAEWSDVRLPYSSFERSNGVLPENLRPTDVISIGIAGYGADYTADLTVAEVRAE